VTVTSQTLPTGEVTLLFTDVEGSTRLWELHGERMLPLLTEHDRIVARAVADAGGVLQTSRAEGDSSFAVFADASAAVRAAIALQRGMAAHAWPPDLVIRTRAALHTGTVEVRGETYYGPVVNRCVRLRSLAHGAQTIASKATYDAVRVDTQSLGDASFADLGTHRLKDLAVPERVYELRHPDLSVGFSPLRSPDVERHNLPELVGRFVGRAEERRGLAKALGNERLVTVVGTGGVGKTRLALEAAWTRVADAASGDPGAEPNEGTWFANLTPAGGLEDVEAILAEAVGAREQPGRPLVETIVDQLADNAALVVLDNCEHVVSAVRQVVQALLRGCPNVRVLATSREALDLDGERRRGVAGLPQTDARELFIERSRLAISTDDGDAIGAIDRACLPLDGIPLAIEIASARAAELGADAVAQGIARAQVEAAGRSVLEATLAWSYDLLEPDERLMFRRLGIFAGQFTLGGAEAVVADSALDVYDVLDLLGALVDRSLVLRTDEGGYRQLFVIREAALRLAREAEEYDALAERHLAWCLALALDRQRPELDERARFDPLRQVNDDLLAALERDFSDELAGLQVQLAGALDEFWYLRGAFSDGRTHLEKVLARGAGFRTHRASVHRTIANLAQSQGHLDDAMDHLTQARSLFEEVVVDQRAAGSEHVPVFAHLLALTLLDSSEIALVRGDARTSAELVSEAMTVSDKVAGRAAMQLGRAEWALGDTDAGTARVIAALRVAEESGDELLEGDCFRTLGVLARAAGRLELAESYYRSALEVDRRLGGEQLLAHTLLSLAELLELRGADPIDALNEGLALARALGDRRAEAHGLSTLAEITAAADPAAAAALHEEVLERRLVVGIPAEIGLSQIRVGAFAEFAGRMDDATQLTQRAASTFRALTDDRGAVEALAQLARIEARRGRTAGAVAALNESLERAANTSVSLERADILEAAAWLAANQRRRSEARALLDHATALRQQLGLRPTEPTRRLRDDLAAEVGAVAATTLDENDLLSAVLAV
jgi:predicted ATPase